MPTLDSYLFFDGACAEAMRFYQQVLGGDLQPMLTYADGPDGGAVAPGDKGRIMHACLVLDGRMLMASDSPTPEPGAVRGFAVALNYPKAEDARRTYDALAAGGSVTMPLQKTFWSEAFGMVTDRFGTPWMVGGGAQARP